RSPSTPVLRGELAAAVWDQVDAVLRLEAEGIEVRIQALEESLADALLLGDDREAVAGLDDVVRMLRPAGGLGRRGRCGRRATGAAEPAGDQRGGDDADEDQREDGE